MADNKSEQLFRDTQEDFGHLGHGLKIESWLHDNYYPDSIRERRYRSVARMFLEGSKDLKVLEIAAGTGDFIVYCSKLFPLNRYFANDLSEKQLSKNILKVASHFKIAQIPELNFGPVEELSYPGDCFDIIFIKGSVHHFEDPEKAFQQIKRVLKRGGRVIFFEDPVVLNIPLYRSFKKRNFSKKEKNLGINEHTYTENEYLSLGTSFSSKESILDQELVNEFDRNHTKRRGVKRILSAITRNNPFIFKQYMIKRFSPLIFIFEK